MSTIPPMNMMMIGMDRPAVTGSAMDDSHRNPNKIFIGGLSQETHSNSLRSYFAQFGRVVDAAIVADKMTGRSRGFGFCSFSSEESVDRCLQQKHTVDDVMVEIRRAVPRDEARTGSYESESSGKLFIGGLPDEVNEDILREFFERFGPVREANLMYNKMSHRPRGFGFVIFQNPDDSLKAVGEHVIANRTIEAKKATPRQQERGFNKRGGYMESRRGGGYAGRGGYDVYRGPGYYDPYAAPYPGSGGYQDYHPKDYPPHGGLRGGYGDDSGPPYGYKGNMGYGRGSMGFGREPPYGVDGYSGGPQRPARYGGGGMRTQPY